MDKNKLLASFHEVMSTKRSVSKHLLSIVKVGGLFVFVCGVIGFVAGFFLLISEGTSGAYTIGISFSVMVQGAMILVVGEVGHVVRDNSILLRRICAGKTTAAN